MKTSSLLLTALLATTPLTALAADGKAVLGSAIGAAAGTAIGSELGGRDGAIVGGAIGGATGAAIGSRNGKSSGGTRVVEKQVIVVHEHDRDFVPPGHRKHKHNKGHHHGHKKH